MSGGVGWGGDGRGVKDLYGRDCDKYPVFKHAGFATMSQGHSGNLDGSYLLITTTIAINNRYFNSRAGAEACQRGQWGGGGGNAGNGGGGGGEGKLA